MNNANIFHLLGVLEGAQRYCSLYPLRGTRILPQGCTIVSWLLLSHLCIPYPPWLAAVWNCPLKLREGHRGWNLFLKKKKQGTQKDVCTQEPHRVLLSFICGSISPLWRREKTHNLRTKDENGGGFSFYCHKNLSTNFCFLSLQLWVCLFRGYSNSGVPVRMQSITTLLTEMIAPTGHGGNSPEVRRFLRTLHSTSSPIVAFNERLSSVIGRIPDVSWMTVCCCC